MVVKPIGISKLPRGPHFQVNHVCFGGCIYKNLHKTSTYYDSNEYNEMYLYSYRYRRCVELKIQFAYFTYSRLQTCKHTNRFITVYPIQGWKHIISRLWQITSYGTIVKTCQNNIKNKQYQIHIQHPPKCVDCISLAPVQQCLLQNDFSINVLVSLPFPCLKNCPFLEMEWTIEILFNHRNKPWKWKRPTSCGKTHLFVFFAPGTGSPKRKKRKPGLRRLG